MNITGQVYFPHVNNQAGLFTTESNDWKFGYGPSAEHPIYWGYSSFNASKSWTGEIIIQILIHYIKI